MAKTPKALPAREWLEPRVRISRVVSLICFLGMIALLSVYYLLFADLRWRYQLNRKLAAIGQV